MKRILSILIVSILLLSVGCGNSEDGGLDIPKLKVTCEDVEIEVSRGGFQWDGAETKSESPDIIAGRMKGNIVAPNAELRLEFTKESENIEVYTYENNESLEYENFQDKKITVPKEEGIYVFYIKGFWEKGDVGYIVKIIVE